MAKYICARCEQEVYCDEFHPRRVCSFCAVRGKRSGRLPEEPSPWNEYATRVLEDTPAREEEMGISRPGKTDWKRCGKSRFYGTKEIKNHLFFIDPISLTIVSVTHWKNGAITVVKKWVEELAKNTFSLLNEAARNRVNSWLQHVVGSFKATKGWKDALLDDLDRDPIERDQLLDALYLWFIASDQKFEDDGGRVEANEVDRLLREFGVPAC